VAALEMEVAAFAAAPRVFSDVGFWAGVVPGSGGKTLQVRHDRLQVGQYLLRDVVLVSVQVSHTSSRHPEPCHGTVSR
jgi:hypothetical protein